MKSEPEIGTEEQVFFLRMEFCRKNFAKAATKNQEIHQNMKNYLKQQGFIHENI